MIWSKTVGVSGRHWKARHLRMILCLEKSRMDVTNGRISISHGHFPNLRRSFQLSLGSFWKNYIHQNLRAKRSMFAHTCTWMVSTIICKWSGEKCTFGSGSWSFCGICFCGIVSCPRVSVFPLWMHRKVSAVSVLGNGSAMVNTL